MGKDRTPSPPHRRRPATNPGQPHRWTPAEAKVAGQRGGLEKARRVRESVVRHQHARAVALDDAGEDGSDPEEEDEQHG